MKKLQKEYDFKRKLKECGIAHHYFTCSDKKWEKEVTDWF